MPKNVTNGSVEIHRVSAHDNPPILSGQIAHGGCGFSMEKQIK